MRLFGSDRIVKYMDRLGVEDGEVIQHSMITKSIERAQKKVEENNFGIRKRLLEYDDVMNSQREVIYTKRRHALYGERIQVDLSNMIYDTCESMVTEHHTNADYEGFEMDLIRVFSVSSPFTSEAFLKGNPVEMAEKLYNDVWSAYQRKVEAIAAQAMPVIKDVYETKSHQYKNIVVPFTDGQRMMQITTNLEKAYNTNGAELVKSLEKSIILMTIDNAWKEHLRELDDLRTAVQNASYEQKDPLLIYKFESFELFKSMLDKANKDVVSTLVKANIPVQDPNEIREEEVRRRQDLSGLKASREALGGDGSQKREKPKAEPVRVEKKVGRNEPCPCGSGKKYKQCHGKGQPA